MGAVRWSEIPDEFVRPGVRLDTHVYAGYTVPPYPNIVPLHVLEKETDKQQV